MSAASPLHLVRLMVDRRAMNAFAARRKLLDDDLGYALHLSLRLRFGEAGPQPFRLMPHDPASAPPDRATVLGYSRDVAGLEKRFRDEAAADGGEDGAPLSGLFPQPPESRAMPTDWSSLPELDFEVLVRPVRRHGAKVLAARRQADAVPLGGEHDAFLSAVNAVRENDPAPSRESVYASWLKERLASAAEVVGDCRLETFRRTRLRRSQHARGKTRTVEGPEALMKGRLRITDGEAFDTVLGKGVGRHAAFGFGMLLLSPARD